MANKLNIKFNLNRRKIQRNQNKLPQKASSQKGNPVKAKRTLKDSKNKMTKDKIKWEERQDWRKKPSMSDKETLTTLN